MNRPRLFMSTLAVAIYLTGIVALFPASLAQRWFAPQLPGLALGAVDGTVWQGRIDGLGWRGIELGSLDWSLRPLALLTMTAAADVVWYRPGAAPLNAFVQADTSGRVEVENLRGALTLEELAAARLLPANVASGELLLDLERAVLQDGRPQALDGRITLSGLHSTLLPGVPLGNYEAEVETTDAGVRGSFRDADAPLRVNGEAQLQPDGGYSVNGSITPLDRTPDALQRGLMLLGPPDASGRYNFRFNGRL